VSFSGGPFPGAGWFPIVRNFQDFFGRFASYTTNLRAVANWVLPVTVIDRFRGDDEGSLFGIEVFTPSAVSQFPACAFGSADLDFEVWAICFGFIVPPGFTSGADAPIHVFTPIAPYNPIVNLNPVGVFVPGLITNAAFSFGAVQGAGGSNIALPLVRGHGLHYGRVFSSTVTTTYPGSNEGAGGYHQFNPPIRVRKDSTLAVQSQFANVGDTFPMRVSILYNQRPATTTQTAGG